MRCRLNLTRRVTPEPILWMTISASATAAGNHSPEGPAALQLWCWCWCWCFHQHCTVSLISSQSNWSLSSQTELLGLNRMSVQQPPTPSTTTTTHQSSHHLHPTPAPPVAGCEFEPGVWSVAKLPKSRWELTVCYPSLAPATAQRESHYTTFKRQRHSFAVRGNVWFQSLSGNNSGSVTQWRNLSVWWCGEQLQSLASQTSSMTPAANERYHYTGCALLTCVSLAVREQLCVGTLAELKAEVAAARLHRSL